MRLPLVRVESPVLSGSELVAYSVLKHAHPAADEETLLRASRVLARYVEDEYVDPRFLRASSRAVADELDAILREVPLSARVF